MLTVGEQKRALYEAAFTLMNEKLADVYPILAIDFFHDDIDEARDWYQVNSGNIYRIRQAMKLAANAHIEQIYPGVQNGSRLNPKRTRKLSARKTKA